MSAMGELPKALATGFVPRPLDAHKRSVGLVAVAGGSAAYPHAPVVAGLGARAGGAGLVRLIVPVESRPAAGALLPEATFARAAELAEADAVVAGPGFGRSPETRRRMVRLLVLPLARVVLDADALWALAELAARRGGVPAVPGRELVLTPHEGEAARLLGVERDVVAADRPGAARAIAVRYGATVALKGPRTLVVSADCRRAFENPAGNPQMALGGMGDLLAGMVAARWACLRGDPFLAAAAAVWLHSAAADRLVAEGAAMSLAAVAERAGALRIKLETNQTAKGKPK